MVLLHKRRLRLLLLMLLVVGLLASTATAAFATNWNTYVVTGCNGSQAAHGWGSISWEYGNIGDSATTNAALYWWDGSNWNHVQTSSKTAYGGANTATADVYGSGHVQWTTTAVWTASFFSGQRTGESPGATCY